MMGNTLNGVLFLIGAIFDIYIILIIMRLILAWAGADYSHPVTKLVVRFTSPIVNRMKKVLPDIHGFELSTLVLLFLVETLKFFLITILSFGMPNILGLFILALGDAIKLILNMFFYAILLQAVLSWVQPGSPIIQILDKLTSPIMRPLRRLIPPVSGIDVSPIPALILLQFLIIVLVDPLLGFGLAKAVGT